MTDIDKVLFKSLLLHGNETTLLNDITYQNYKTLLIELTKIKYDIRYCKNKNCPCHPETSIKRLLNNKDLCDFLQENRLLGSINDLIESYIPIVAEGIYEDG